MTHTSEWLDSVQELGLNMSESGDSNADRHLFKVLGSLGSDVKHSLSLLERSRQDTTQLRLDMRQDLNDQGQKFSSTIHELKAELKLSTDKLYSEHAALELRVDKLEHFQTKIMTWAAVLIPLAIIVGQALAPAMLSLLQ